MYRNHVLALTLALAAAAAAAAAACSDRQNQATADSELAQDIALANRAPVSPILSDTAFAEAEVKLSTRPPVRAAKAPAPRRVPTPRTERPRVEPAPTVEESAPAPAPRRRGFLAGTSFALTTNSPVCTTNLPGDKITATLTSAVIGDDGAYLPVGTTVVLEVASVTPGDRPETAQISLRVRSILLNDESLTMEGDVAVVSDLERREVPRNKNSDRRKVVAGAVAGAIIGQIMGKDTRSTVIGAAAGGAAGAAAAVASRQYDACLPAGGSLRVTTSQPIILGD